MDTEQLATVRVFENRLCALSGGGYCPLIDRWWHWWLQLQGTQVELKVAAIVAGSANWAGIWLDRYIA